MHAEILHASCVAFGGRGLLILGRSGSGKSALALQMMAYGAALVADDRTEVILRDSRLIARAPAALVGLIEARGLGILRADALEEVEISLCVDLEAVEPDRLPPLRHRLVLGQRVSLVHGAKNPHLAPALLQYLRAGRQH